MSRLEDFHNQLGSMDWYHGGKATDLTKIVNKGMDVPEQPEPGQGNGSMVYGKGLYLASDPEDIKKYYARPESDDSGVLTARLKPRRPLVNVRQEGGVVTPGHKDRLLMALDHHEKRIDARTDAGEFDRTHAGYLKDKLRTLREDVQYDSSSGVGRAAHLAGYDAYITDDHQLPGIKHEWDPVTDEGRPVQGTSLQATVFHPRALQPLRVHDSKQFYEMLNHPMGGPR